MKRLAFGILAALMVLFAACDDDDKKVTPVGETKEVYIDATSGATWNYYSFAKGELVGTGQEGADNAKWFARTDWDIAVCRYHIRTNSGTSSTTGAKGGVHVFDKNTSFASIKELPKSLNFQADKEITIPGAHGSEAKVISKSAQAAVILFDTDENGNIKMPPVYLKSPIYMFRTADGKANYKVEFTQYKDAEGNSGHVKFNMAEVK